MDPRIQDLLDHAETYPGAVYYITPFGADSLSGSNLMPPTYVPEEHEWNWNNAGRYWYTRDSFGTPVRVYEPGYRERTRYERAAHANNSNQDLVFKAH